MAVVAIASNHPDNPSIGINGYKWLLVLNGDSGGPLLVSWMSDRSVTVTGTFGAGGTLIMEGSNDGVNYHPLKDIFGSAVSFTASGIKGIGEIATYIRPRVTAGDGTTSLNVHLTAVGSP